MSEQSKSSHYYPIFLGISNQKCVVFGGGNVALRKVRMLLDHGAKVDVISPVFCPELRHLAENNEISTLHRGFEAKDLIDATVAIAATDSTETNENIAAEARRQGTLVNVVDNPLHSDFIVPSYLKRGDITIAVSTSGKSPALARKIRSKIEHEFGNEYAQLALLVSEVRLDLKKQDIAIDNDVWQEALNLESLTELLRNGKNQEAKDTLLGNLKKRGQRKQ